MYATMRTYYEHRGTSSKRELAAFCKQSQYNMQQLQALRSQFDTVIGLMHEFLEHGLYKTDSSSVKGAKHKFVTFRIPVVSGTIS